MSKLKHILVIEDDISLAEWIKEYFTNHQFQVTVLHSGTSAVESIKNLKPDLVVLDIMLPGKNGFDICKEARQFYACPILMMTACNEESDEVLSLELGADDYLTKPIRPRAMLARVQAMLKRSTLKTQETSIVIGNMVLSKETKSTEVANKKLTISNNEFDVLWLLASQQNQVVSRSDLISQLRGIEYDGFDRSIDIRVSRLRKKLCECHASIGIKTIWGKGYLLSMVEQEKNL